MTDKENGLSTTIAGNIFTFQETSYTLPYFGIETGNLIEPLETKEFIEVAIRKGCRCFEVSLFNGNLEIISQAINVERFICAFFLFQQYI